jgi:hypothetical protein
MSGLATWLCTVPEPAPGDRAGPSPAFQEYADRNGLYLRHVRFTVTITPEAYRAAGLDPETGEPLPFNRRAFPDMLDRLNKLAFSDMLDQLDKRMQ